LDEYIVMPNHIHGIIRINKTKLKQKPNGNDLSAKGMGNGCDGDNCRDGTTGDGYDGDNCTDGATGDGYDGDNCTDGATGDGYDGDNCTDGATGDGRDAINRVSTVAQTADVPLINEPTTDVPLINETTDVPLINAPSTDIPIFHDNISNGPPTRNSITNKQGGITGNNNPMLYDNLSRIIRWYKGRVTFETRKILTGFSWQSRFHDRIIHNEEQLARVRQYIINNPQNWDNDKLKLK
jgi:hypothetical protein